VRLLRLLTDERIRAFNVEGPVAGETMRSSLLRVWGWVVPSGSPLRAVELRDGETLVGCTDGLVARDDVRRAFPDYPWAALSGFAVQVDLQSSPSGELALEAVTAADQRIRLAELSIARPEVTELKTPEDDSAALLPSPDGSYDLTSEEALARFKSSPAMRWAKFVDDDPPPGTAWQRIMARPLFTPVYRPEFEIRPDDRVFAIGSCFARGVEGALASLGMTVESRTQIFDEFEVAEGVIGAQHGFTNKYTTESIRNELVWALRPGAEFPPEALVDLRNGTWQDPHAVPNLRPTTRLETLARHRLLSELVRKISGCRVVVITLGLIEVFYDTVTGLYTNCTPPLSADPTRFRFRLLDFAKSAEALDEIHALLSSYGHPDTQIVVTVSPVPLQATFTGVDVVVANTHSKAVLRAAAAEWVTRHSNVHYFPSYEIVMNSDRRVVWRKDGRHVRNEVVREIMNVFLRAHVKAGPRQLAPVIVGEGAQ
jgi:hypothetical protein